MKLQRLAKTTACTHVEGDPMVVNKAGSKACTAVQCTGREARTEQGSALSQSTVDMTGKRLMPFMKMSSCS